LEKFLCSAVPGKNAIPWTGHFGAGSYLKSGQSIPVNFPGEQRHATRDPGKEP